MNVTIGPRLRAIAEYVPIGCRLADIGSDHGYLPAWLVLHERVAKTIAGEINQDPARRALETCQEYDLAPQMEVRLGDGLSMLAPGEIDVIVIAGMGGTTIRQILDQGKGVLAHVRRLILQPNVAATELRRWLIAHHFAIVEETLVEENGIIYEVIVAEPGQAEPISDLEALLGPILIKRRPALFHRQVEAAIDERQYVLLQLAKASSAEAESKRLRLEQEILDLRAMIN